MQAQFQHREPTMFESLCNTQVTRGESVWGSFSDEKDWELGQWILKSGTIQASMNELLQLKKVSKIFLVEYRVILKHCTSQFQKEGCTSFHNSRSLFQKIDALLSGPKWTCELFEIEGDILNESGALQTETVELWHQNPVECIQELIGNPDFK